MSEANKKKKPNQVNLIVKESITEALFSLMEKERFSDITVSELTEKAGVGRVSFYRNYDSKEDVILQYMLKISTSYWTDHHKEDPSTLWKMTFELFVILKPTIILLRKSQIDTVIFYKFLKECTLANKAEDKKEGYYLAMYTGLAFGLYDQWLHTGMHETSEELYAMFKELVLPYKIKPLE